MSGNPRKLEKQNLLKFALLWKNVVYF